ncbi:MAG: DUF1566 domain-containing protein [Candidatus Nitronauta litoralis]|uniref:DUF1566 domain-containing protein n=1 Tax=Candidatus Nitronauta litoralis TaxID=2705533 RepID=A0A7T0BYM5_9BACT|nr:MAG: DUF1566 domain-containing protein [Candidatus Nitronauta litoralis]
MTTEERFQDNPSGLISDKLHKKFWLPKDSQGDLGKWVNWEEAKNYILTMCHVYAGGFSDWRLPTKEEALSLYVPELNCLDHEGEVLHIAPVFVPKGGQYLWTSEENEEGQALRVNLREGTSEFVDKQTREFHATRGVRDMS